MTEQIKPEEALARACASVSTPSLQNIVNGIQAYHEQYYNELVNATGEQIARAQGKVQATAQIVKVILDCRNIVNKIDARRAANSPNGEKQRMAM
jgi:hypothetical protein